MSETLEQTCARNPQWAADEITTLTSRVMAAEARAEKAEEALDALTSEAFNLDPMPTCAASAVPVILDNLRTFIRVALGDHQRATLAEQRLASAEKERDALRRHYDAAGPEHNLLASRAAPCGVRR